MYFPNYENLNEGEDDIRVLREKVSNLNVAVVEQMKTIDCLMRRVEFLETKNRAKLNDPSTYAKYSPTIVMGLN